METKTLLVHDAAGIDLPKKIHEATKKLNEDGFIVLSVCSLDAKLSKLPGDAAVLTYCQKPKEEKPKKEKEEVKE